MVYERPYHHLNPDVYQRIANSIDRLARQGNPQVLTVDMVDWQHEAGVEQEPGTAPLGVYQEQGDSDADLWVRYTSFNPEAESILRHGFNDAFTVLTRQLDLRKVSEHAQLQARIRTIEHSTGGRVYFAFDSALHHSMKPVERQSYLAFVNQYGLHTVWKEAERSPEEFHKRGFMATKRAQPIARALGELAAAT